MNSFNRYNNLLNSDLYKLKHLKSIIVAPLIMLLLILLQYAVFWWQQSLNAGATIPQEILSTYLLTGKSMLFESSSYIALGLFIAIFCGIFIGGEFKDGTIKSIVARGAGRVHVYFSKWLTMEILTIGFVLGSFLICGILSGASGYGAEFNGMEFGHLLRSLILQILVAVSSTSIYVLIAFLARSQGSTIGISLGLYIIWSIVSVIIATIIIATSPSADASLQASEALSYFPGQQLSIACSSAELGVKDILIVIFMPIAYTLLSCCIGLFTFVKRDIK